MYLNNKFVKKSQRKNATTYIATMALHCDTYVGK